MPNPILSGQRFGRLVVLKRHGSDRYRSPVFLCVCDCGNETVVRRWSLIGGDTTSCGCFQKECAAAKNRKHGHAVRGKATKEYRAWFGMIVRCKTHHNLSRGISVCSEWEKSFNAFFEHVGPAPSPSHSLGRIDNDRGYEVGNVRWETVAQQQNNKSNSVRLTFNGRTEILSEWARILGLSRSTLKGRMEKYEDVEKILAPRKAAKSAAP